MIRIKLFTFLFLSFGILFFAAIPPTIAPISIADFVLLIFSILSVFYLNKLGVIYVYCTIFWFLISSLIGDLRGISTSTLTGLSLGLKWTGALTVYLFLTYKAEPKLTIIKILTAVQLLVLFSLITNIRPFSDDFYSGFNGIFQASADGGYYLVCSLGFFLHLYKTHSTKLIGFNVVISLLSLFMVDSRFGAILGSGGLFYYLLTNKKGRSISLAFFVILCIAIFIEAIHVPPKLRILLSEIDNPQAIIGDDVSMLIRINNFATAFDITSFAGYIIGNGAKFFQLSTSDFFYQNYSLDNSYIYLLLSFGLPGIILFYLVFLSKQGFGIHRRGALTFFCLAFPIMQDTFSNSFCLLSLAIFLSADTIISKIDLELIANTPENQ